LVFFVVELNYGKESIEVFKEKIKAPNVFHKNGKEKNCICKYVYII